MTPPVPHTSQAIRRQIAALDALIRQQSLRRDALLMRSRTPREQQELDKSLREINRLWQGKDYWKGLLDVRLAWERAMRGTRPRPPKQLPKGPPAPPAPPSPFERMPRRPERPIRGRVPHFVPPFPPEPYPIPAFATAEERRCLQKWNTWRERAQMEWNRWLRDLGRWEQDMDYWQQEQVRRGRREEGLSKPPARPFHKVPAPPKCPLPQYGEPA